ncbi:MAG: rhamnulose-1-phosphate aldolase [Spirochaetaceae bacterium]|jgi:rhamnulose-1-phosphate aldolase|nr:rhamnulose-1-phosphate aldolase [Spirochaetaceae bacterium]
MIDLPFVDAFIRMADDAFYKGWHERNGGNLSYRLTDDERAAAEVFWNAEAGPAVPLEAPASVLAGDVFLVTGSGKYMRNVILAPEESLALVEITADGAGYYLRWGLSAGGRPTSELPTHLLNHAVKKAAGKRVIYHAHPGNVIALTYILPLTHKAFTRALWESATECPVVFPEGIGVVPWMVPGGKDIAAATSAEMKHRNIVVWAHHGLFCAGADFDEAFGLMDTVEKAAEICVKVLSMGGARQTITEQNFSDLAKSFGVTLAEL